MHEEFTRQLQEVQSILEKDQGAIRNWLETAASTARNQKGASPEKLFAQFVQFCGAARAANFFIRAQELNIAGDYLMWALTDQIIDGPQQCPEISRLQAFVSNRTLQQWSHFVPVYSGWLGDFFYYCRRRAAFKNVADEIWQLSKAFFNLTSFRLNEDGAWLGASMLAWASQESQERAKELIPMIEQLAANQGKAPHARKLLAITLAGSAGRFSKHAQDHWENIALNELETYLENHERLQLLANRFGRMDCDDLFESLLEEIDRYQTGYGQDGLSGEVALRSMDFHSDYLKVILHACLSRRQSDRAIKAIGRWYGIQADKLVSADFTLLVCPFHSEGYVALAGKEFASIPGDNQDLLTRLTNAENRFYGSSTSVVGASSQQLHLPLRPGVPDSTEANNFAVALEHTYCPNEAAVALTSQTTQSQLVIPSKSHPIQAIQLESHNQTYPIAASLCRRLDDRPLRNVAIWSGAASGTEEMERDALEIIFRANGVRFKSISPDQATADGFFQIYGDDAFDCIWLMSHGHFDHYSPKDAELQICQDGTSIRLSELLGKTPECPKRRLLMMNVCDGGRFEQFGVLPRVGLAPGLASATQAVVSHLWPVHGITAAAFGTLFAIGLVRGDGFFEAFKASLLKIKSTLGEVANIIEQQIGTQCDLTLRLANQSLDFASLEHWGSPVFYE